MATKRRGLGRGLDALLGDAAPTEAGAAPAGDQLTQLPVEQITRGRYQPRSAFDSDALNELADSIRAQGVVQPVVVRLIGEGRYELIAGERRWRAAQLAELREIPAVVREVPDEAAMAMALIENIQREDLNPLEEAGALQRLKTEFGLTHEQVAHAVGRSRVAVTNLMRLMELNQDVKDMIADGRLEMGHARALLSLKGGEQSEAARQVVARKLTVRDTELLVRNWTEQGASPRKAAAPAADPNVTRLQQELSERLGASVSIQDKQGKGKLVIQYHSLDELEGILSHMK